jgi:hypothetical protein
VRRALGLLAAATLAALAGAVATLALVARADLLAGPAEVLARLVFDHALLAVTAAGSPILAVLLVGYAYMQRAIRRRGASKAGATGAAP